MKLIIYCSLLIITLSTHLRAEDDCCKKEVALPKDKSFSQFEKIAGVLSTPKTPPKTPKCFTKNDLSKDKALPEKKFKEMMKGLSDEEVFKRLILAETMASTCPSTATAEAIAWVVKNRVDAKDAKRFGLGREVVFKDYQFRSSTGDCDVAMTKVFMCPTSIGTNQWEQMWKMAEVAYEKTKSASNPISKESYQYFFYKHFDKSVNCKKWKGVLPAWASSNREVKTSLSLDKSCIKVFR